jgi:hypothetical protein
VSVRPIVNQFSGLVLALAAMGSDAFANEPTPEVQLVEAFQSHCIATSADMAPFTGKLELRGTAYLTDDTHVNVWGMSLAVREAPHRKIEVHFAEHRRMCSASLAFADKAVVMAALKERLALGEGTTVARKEITFESTSWKTRVGEHEAFVEFGASGAADRMLSVVVGEPP